MSAETSLIMAICVVVLMITSLYVIYRTYLLLKEPQERPQESVKVPNRTSEMPGPYRGPIESR